MKRLFGFSLTWREKPHRFGALGVLTERLEIDRRAPLPAILAEGSQVAPEDPRESHALKKIITEWLAQKPQQSGLIFNASWGAWPDQGRMGATVGAKRIGRKPERAVALPPIVVMGVGHRSSEGQDRRTPPPLRHVVRLPGLELTAEDVRHAIPLLRGFFLRAIAWKERDPDALDTVRRWRGQGTHVRRIVIEPIALSLEDGDLVLEFKAGLEGGLAEPVDAGQAWTGFDGYVAVLHLGLAIMREPPRHVRIATDVGPASGSQTISAVESASGAEDFVSLAGFELTVDPVEETPRAQLTQGRLLRSMGLNWKRKEGALYASWSNEGVVARPYSFGAAFHVWYAAAPDPDDTELTEIAPDDVTPDAAHT